MVIDLLMLHQCQYPLLVTIQCIATPAQAQGTHPHRNPAALRSTDRTTDGTIDAGISGIKEVIREGITDETADGHQHSHPQAHETFAIESKQLY